MINNFFHLVHTVILKIIILFLTAEKLSRVVELVYIIKNCYKFNLIDELTIINEKNFESIFIKIQLDNENLFRGNIYRFPL